MRSFLLMLGVLLPYLGFSNLVATSRMITALDESLRARARTIVEGDGDVDRFEDVAQRIKTRAHTYDRLIQQTHLIQGMVVQRNIDGTFFDECDSLLFSAFRYVSLVKLGDAAEADKAWKAIGRSQIGGKWLRHPICFEPLSRDMLMGLIMVLSQNLSKHNDLLITLISYLTANNGFFGDGRPDQSMISPTIAELLRRLTILNGWAPEALPFFVRYGFSAIEIDTLFCEKGYQSHLIGLTLWQELELQALSPNTLLGPRSPMTLAGFLTNPFTHERLGDQRMRMMADELLVLDSDNLFFRYLKLRTTGLLTLASRTKLLEELDAMDQFPRDRLPKDCDRKADFLWQRSSDEYAPNRACRAVFNGVDFLWMAALLLEGGENGTALTVH